MVRTLRGRDWTSMKVRVVWWGRARMGWCSGCWTCWRRRGAGRRRWGWPPPSPPSSSSSSPSSSTSTSLSTSVARREYRYFAECSKRQLCECLLWESPCLVRPNLLQRVLHLPSVGPVRVFCRQVDSSLLFFRFATSQFSLWVASSTWPTSPPPPSPSSGQPRHHLSGENSNCVFLRIC